VRYRGAFVKCVGVGVNVCVCVCVCERVRECWFVVFGRSRHTCVCVCGGGGGRGAWVRFVVRSNIAAGGFHQHSRPYTYIVWEAACEA